MNTKSLKTLEYDKIIAQLEEYASSPLGKQLCRDLLPSVDITQIRGSQAETTDALTRVRQKGSLSFSGLKDVARLPKASGDRQFPDDHRTFIRQRHADHRRQSQGLRTS